MSVGTKVVLFGKTAAVVIAASSNGKRLHVKKVDCGAETWVTASNAKAVS